MGFISKAQTKNRTAPKQFPNQLGNAVERVWAMEKLLQTVAVMFGAQSMTSSVLRGRQSTLVSLFNVGEVTSDFWYEKTAFTNWQLTIGAESTKGIAVDWAVSVQLGSAPEGPIVAVNTIHALTVDGALVKGELHDLLRETIGTSASSGELPDSTDTLLQEIVSASYAAPVHPVLEKTPSSFRQRFSIVSPMNQVDIQARIVLLGFRAEAISDWHFVYEIGIEGFPSGSANLFIDVAKDSSKIRGEVTFDASDDPVADAVAFQMCRGFAEQCLAILKLFGGEAILEIERNQ